MWNWNYLTCSFSLVSFFKDKWLCIQLHWAYKHILSPPKNRHFAPPRGVKQQTLTVPWVISKGFIRWMEKTDCWLFQSILWIPVRLLRAKTLSLFMVTAHSQKLAKKTLHVSWHWAVSLHWGCLGSLLQTEMFLLLKWNKMEINDELRFLVGTVCFQAEVCAWDYSTGVLYCIFGHSSGTPVLLMSLTL